MKRKTFYIITIALICIGTIAGLYANSQTSTSQCSGDDCINVIKEYKAPIILEDTSLEEKTEMINNDSTSDDENESSEIEKIQDNQFIADEDVETKANADYARNGFFAGKNISLNHHFLDGLLFAAGDKIKSHGGQEYLFAAGSTLSIDSETQKDAFLAGAEIDFSNKAKIRDLFAAGETITIRGRISGDSYIGASTLIFDNATLLGDVTVDAENIEFKGYSVINGVLNYNEGANTTNLDKDSIAGITSYKSEFSHEQSLSAVIAKKIESFCACLVSISLLALLASNLFEKSKDKLATKGVGNRAVLCSFLGILVAPALTILLILIDFLRPIGFLLLIALALAFILSLATAAVCFGKIINRDIIKDKKANVYSICLIGAAAYALFSLMPYGGLIIAAMILLSFGFVIDEIVTRVPASLKNSFVKKN